MAMVSAATLKTYLPEITGSLADSDLSDLLERVECATARYFGWVKPDGANDPQLLAATYTFYLNGPTFGNPSVLQIPIRPVNSITSIHSDPNRQYTDDTQVSSDDFDLDSLLGQAILDPVNATDSFEYAFRAIKVVANCGYTTLPADLEHAICVWASQLHRNKATQGKESITQRAATVSISPKSMPPEVKEYLAPFRESRQIL
tara:strand:- start:21387 stop:21995 length:609 start_codon:yes stop_codon:yes gene_type:complete